MSSRTSKTRRLSRANLSDSSKPPTPRGFWAIWTAVVVDLLGFGIVIPLLPLYAESFGASAITIGVLFASYSVAQFVFAPIWGRLSDRVGRRPVLLISIAGSAAGSLVLAMAGSIPVLLFGRILDGVSGASVAVARATVADSAEPRDRPRLMGLLGAAYGIGLVAGPAIGSLAALHGPATPFVVAAVISALNLVAAVRRLPETRSRRRVGAPQVGTGAPSRTVFRLVGLTFVSVAIFSVFETTFALLAADRLRLGAAAVGAVFALFGVVWVVTQGRLVGPVARRWGEPITMRAGIGLNVVGFGLLAFSHGWGTLAPALTLIAVGQGLLTPTLSSAIASATPSANTGRSLGFQQSASGLARVVGPLAGGAVYVLDPALAYAGAVVAGVAILPLISSPGSDRRSGSV